MPKKVVIDPENGVQIALCGRVVTMNREREVYPDAVVYISGGCIQYIRRADDPVPEEFEQVKRVKTRGTIYPGLIELHNHLSYNALPMWQVPGIYENRNQWGSSGEPHIYRRLVSGPMKILGRQEHFPSVVRYVEVKALVAGTTTSQGIALYSNKSSRRYYRGLIRNVEQTNEDVLPHAKTRIADILRNDLANFKKNLDRSHGAYILHLAEGVDASSNRYFQNLCLPSGEWALSEKYIGIHCVALTRSDFRVMARYKAKMVWSPLSNLLLYGKTARVMEALEEGVEVCLGSDWSVSGSKNLLGELKIAHLTIPEIKPVELLAMATCIPANAIGWGKHLGSLEEGKKADFFVIPGTENDPYEQILHANDNTVSLVYINGIPRFGTARTMKTCGVTDGEPLMIKRRSKLLNLGQATADPEVGALSYRDAVTHLDSAMENLKDLAREPDRAPAGDEEVWALSLDEDDDDIRVPGYATSDNQLPDTARAEPLWEILEPIKRDPLAVADDKEFFRNIRQQRNLPEKVKMNLRRFY